MAKYLFNEPIIREDHRKGTYIIPYIFAIIISIALAILPWILVPRVAILNALMQHAADQATFLTLFNAYFPPITSLKIIITIVFGLLAIIFLGVGLRNLLTPRLILTANRLCLMKRPRKYYEARFNKITAFVIKGHKLKVYADGKKVFGFGPLDKVYAIRNEITEVMDKTLGQSAPEKTPCEFVPISVSEPEHISRDGDMFS